MPCMNVPCFPMNVLHERPGYLSKNSTNSKLIVGESPVFLSNWTGLYSQTDVGTCEQKEIHYFMAASYG